jgi:hypothetical protein
MRNVLFFALFLNLCVNSFGNAAQVVLPEDEIILPPYLKAIINRDQAEERFNVVGIGGLKREARKEEWLDYGDTLDLPGRVAFEVLQRESIQWVGGGVFKGKIGSGLLANPTDEQIYEVTVERGWIKVWIRPDAHLDRRRKFSNERGRLLVRGAPR